PPAGAPPGGPPPAAGGEPAASLPASIHSRRGGSTSPGKVTGTATTPGGGAGASLGTPAWRRSITSSHTGAAPVTPLTSCMGAPEKFPTHTPTVNRRENPMHQLSRMSVLVPVLTAVQKRVERAFSSPNVALRLSRSASTSATRKAVAGSTA